MRWSRVGKIGVAYWQVRPFLPSNLRSKLELLMPYRTPEENQLKKIDELGEKIGLERKEVQAAYNPPLDMNHWRSRMTPLSACIMILAVVVVSFLILALSNPDIIYGPPSSTYVYGTRYGTIRPDNFHSSGFISKKLSAKESKFVTEVLQ